jgi:hypothetical protein
MREKQVVAVVYEELEIVGEQIFISQVVVKRPDDKITDRVSDLLGRLLREAEAN